MKLKTFALAVGLTAFLLGCSDKKDDSTTDTSTPVVAQAGKIEIEENKDAFKPKIEEKDQSNDGSYYYSYNKEKEANDKTYTPVDANMRVRSPYERVEISLLVGKLSKEFIIKCSACHNDYANGVIGPSLLNKDKTFIYNSIMDFKTGKKSQCINDRVGQTNER
jgi:hypothetical protein